MPAGMELHNWVERVTGSPKFIDTDHAYVHEGNAFDAFAVTTGSSASTIRFKTPAATATYPYIHFRPTAISVNAGNVRFQIYDTNTSGMTDGTAVTPVNRKYSSTSTSAVAFSIGVTACSTISYTLKYDRVTHGGTGPGQTRIGVSKGEALEWILNPDTEYAFYATVSAATEVGMNFFWYEEADA